MTLKEWLIVWFKAARAPFLVVSFIPACVGGIIAYNSGAFDWLTFILVTVGIVSAHSAADFIDDYFDFKNGNLGNKEKQFHDSPLIDGKVTLRQVVVATLLCLAISVAIGVYLLLEIGYPVIIMTIIGAFIVLFYTSPPIRLNYRGLGETGLFVAFGPMIVFGVYYVLTRQFSWEPILASIPLGVFIMNVGIVSNIFDYEDDVQSGKLCMPVRIGQANTVKVLAAASIVAYLAVVAGVAFGLLPWWALISLLASPVAIQIVRGASNYKDLTYYTPSMTKAIALSSVTGILLIAGYAMEILLK